MPHNLEYEFKKAVAGLARERKVFGPALRGSGSGRCARALAYQYHDYTPSVLNWRALLVFRFGDMIEETFFEFAKEIGITDQQKEVSVTIDGT